MPKVVADNRQRRIQITSVGVFEAFKTINLVRVTFSVILVRTYGQTIIRDWFLQIRWFPNDEIL
jgi:hypothetical protein